MRSIIGSVLGIGVGIGVGMVLWVSTGHLGVGIGVAAGLAILFSGVVTLRAARV
jgi:hypothetical protein